MHPAGDVMVQVQVVCLCRWRQCIRALQSSCYCISEKGAVILGVCKYSPALDQICVNKSTCSKSRADS